VQLSRTPEGDQLLGIIRALVHGRVPPSQEAVAIEATASTLVAIMSDPKLYSHLRVVQDLQQENWSLRQQILHLQRLLAAYNHPTNHSLKVSVKKAPAKKATVRKAVPRKKVPPSNVRAFKRGTSGR
jgi:hypothetical protein